jgi:hypothetical protein
LRFGIFQFILPFPQFIHLFIVRLSARKYLARKDIMSNRQTILVTGATGVEDTGSVVAAIFDHPDAYIGRTVCIVGADETGSTYAGPQPIHAAL